MHSLVLPLLQTNKKLSSLKFYDLRLAAWSVTCHLLQCILYIKYSFSGFWLCYIDLLCQIQKNFNEHNDTLFSSLLVGLQMSFDNLEYFSSMSVKKISFSSLWWVTWILYNLEIFNQILFFRDNLSPLFWSVTVDTDET